MSKATKINQVSIEYYIDMNASLLSALPCWFKLALINGPAKKLLTQIGAKKRRGKDAHMCFSLIYFSAPFSIFYIPHNYVIPQAVPRVISQTHSSFYPHRKIGGAGKTKKKGERACNHFFYHPLPPTFGTFEIIRFRKSNCDVNELESLIFKFFAILSRATQISYAIYASVSRMTGRTGP